MHYLVVRGRVVIHRQGVAQSYVSQAQFHQ